MRLLCLSTMFLLVGLLPSKGSAISCYSCNSAYDPGCGDPITITSLGVSNCSLTKLDHLNNTESTICRKIVQKYQGFVRVVRSCGFITDEERDDKACFRRSGTHEVSVEYCSCSKDLCNTAALSAPLTATLFMTLLVVLFGERSL